MADKSPHLKRKREGGEFQRKKAKTQEKSKAGDRQEQDESQMDMGVSMPISKSTPKSKSTPQSKQESKLTPYVEVNDMLEESVTTTLSNSQKDEKKLEIKEESNAKGQTAKAEDTSQAQGKKEKKKRSRDKKRKSMNAAVVEDIKNSPIQFSSLAESKKMNTKPNSWSISTPQGGWLLPQDPIFSQDEKYLILANIRAVQIYSTETSLLASALPAGSHGSLTSYALSPTNFNYIYVADSNGLITLWDWAKGLKAGRWDIGAKVGHLVAITQPDGGQDLVYTHEMGSNHVINVHALRTKAQGSKTELKRILKTETPIRGLQILLEGRIVIVVCANSIMIGKRKKLHKTALQDFDYTWREFKTSKRVTTFSAYVRLPQNFGKEKISSQDPRDHLDLAIGDEIGMIHLFEDILTTLAGIEKSRKNSKDKNVNLESLRPKRLHWHREAVGSVKWSLDGNYLISGGDETVLTIWQLATGKQQHLPHLTAAIENVVVSPSGASYALSLANNSVVVVSTTELQAKTNVISIQSRRVDLEQLPRGSNSPNYSFAVFSSIPMVVDPKANSQIIFSTPSSQSRHQKLGLLPEPYVQTFDITSHRPVSRQALTRNNATDPNINPEGRKILEPSIKFLQISHDGNWLATVDEWILPLADTAYLDEGILEFNAEERTYRREVYLKFWQWNDESAQWVLSSRINAPHFFEDVSASGCVFDLVADPASLGFATVGEDRFVRIWKPKTRLRNGVVVRGVDKSKGALVTWSLDQSIEVSGQVDVLEVNSGPQSLLALRTSRLSFSKDGSALATAVSWASESDPGVIHIIDADTGFIRRSITEIDVTALSGLGIIDQYLVLVAESLTVWNIVLDQLVYTSRIDTPGISSIDRIPLIRLAMNPIDGTFAISYPQFEKNDSSKTHEMRVFKKATSKVSIFNTVHQAPIWSSKISEIAMSLVPQRAEKGYVLLDSKASIRLIYPTASALQLLKPPPESKARCLITTGENEDIVVEDEVPRKSARSFEILSGGEDLIQDAENDKPVVRPEQLQELFESGPSYALPSVKDLFNAVVGLYARKPRASTIDGTA